MSTDPSIFGWIQPLDKFRSHKWIVWGQWNGREFCQCYSDEQKAYSVAGFYGFDVRPGETNDNSSIGTRSHATCGNEDLPCMRGELHGTCPRRNLR